MHSSGRGQNDSRFVLFVGVGGSFAPTLGVNYVLLCMGRNL